MAIFSYYEIQTTNETEALTFLRDKLIQHNWNIIVDKIASNKYFIAQIQNNGVYVKFMVQDGQFITAKTSNSYNNNTQDLSTILSYESFNNNGNYILFSLKGLIIFVNSEFLIMFRVVYKYWGTINNICTRLLYLPIFLGKFQSTDQLMSFFVLGEGNDEDWKTIFSESGFGNNSCALYYKDRIFKSTEFRFLGATPNFYYHIFRGNCYYQDNYSSLRRNRINENFPQFFKTAIIEENRFIIKSPIFVKEIINGVEYIYPASETPYYFTYYRGEQDFKDIIEINGKKFMIMPLGLFKDEENNVGIAIEVGNV